MTRADAELYDSGVVKSARVIFVQLSIDSGRNDEVERTS